MTDAFALCNELASGYEPTAANRDDARVRPVEYAPNKLYLWPRTETYPSADTGGSDTWRFYLRLAWGVDAEMEEASITGSATVSQLVQQKVAAIAAWVRGHRAGTNYEWLQIDSVDYEGLATTHLRGFTMELSGYNYLTP